MKDELPLYLGPLMRRTYVRVDDSLNGWAGDGIAAPLCRRLNNFLSSLFRSP